MSLQAAAAVGLYAALNVLILLWLAIATSRLRGRYKVLIGDGGVAHLVRIMRGHANAVENMPMMMVLLLVSAALNTPVFVIHLLGLAFTVGRAIHAWHFVVEDGAKWQRFAGYGLSTLAMLVATLGVLAHALWIII